MTNFLMTDFGRPCSEPTFDARPFMATFDTNKAVNAGKVFRTIDRKILDNDMLTFCTGRAEAYLAEKGAILRAAADASTQAAASSFGGLTGGAYYDRTQNTIFTPSNIFWARFNQVRRGGAGAGALLGSSALLSSSGMCAS